MYITKSFLENYKPTSIVNVKQSKTLFESIKFDCDTYDIFISYSSKDLEYVKKVASILEDQGFKVYIDDNDSVLDKTNVGENTAKRLATIMNNCKCLIYVFTQNSAESFWCPWEMGYMSSCNNFKCAVLPIVDVNRNIEHKEYLLIYPRIEQESHGPVSKAMLYVIKDDEEVDLVEYINS